MKNQNQLVASTMIGLLMLQSCKAWVPRCLVTSIRPINNIGNLMLLHSQSSVDEYGRTIRQRQRERPRKNNNDDWGFNSNDEDDGGDYGWGGDIQVNNNSRNRSRRVRRDYSNDINKNNWGDSDRYESYNKRQFNYDDDADDEWDSFNPFQDQQRSSPSSRVRRVPQEDRNNNDGRFASRDNPRRGGIRRIMNRSNYNNNNNRERPRSNHPNNQRRRRDGGSDNSYAPNASKKDPAQRSINLKALEGAGYVHLYGLSSVLNALKADRRDFMNPDEDIDDRFEILNDLEDDNDADNGEPKPERKPQAQFHPWLFVQDRQSSGRSNSKAQSAQQVEELAKERGIPIATVDKGVLNTLCGNRPHQGFVLRCGKLEFEPLAQIPIRVDNSSPNLWLVLDEVVDPQNLGALIRSAYFLGKIGILVCAKNSAPLSPVTSAASAGALELQHPIYSTVNLPKTLAAAKADGFRIIGASSSLSDNNSDDDMALYDLQDLPPINNNDIDDEDNEKPTLLVLGSEGHGLRNLVAKSCTEFVRIPGGLDTEGVDSLNVSVTGGILMWHLLNNNNNNAAK